MPYRPTVLSFAPSYRCNLTCAHCCVPGRADGLLPLPLALDCVRQASLLGFRGVGFTGGEPLLVPDWVARVVQEAVARGLAASGVSTNGLWWTDLAHLRRVLMRLRRAGFGGSFHLSVDAFHPGAGGERQAQFLQSVLDVFNRTGTLNCAESPRHPALPVLERLARRLGADLVRDSPQRGRMRGPGWSIPFFRFPVAQVDQRARVGVTLGEHWFSREDCFGHDLLALDPAGRAYCCSGFACYRAPGLCLGEVTTGGLPAAQEAADRSPLLTLLAAEGPAGLRRVIEQYEPHAFPVPWPSACSFCYHCLTDHKLSYLLRQAGVL